MKGAFGEVRRDGAVCLGVRSHRVVGGIAACTHKTHLRSGALRENMGNMGMHGHYAWVLYRRYGHYLTLHPSSSAGLAGLVLKAVGNLGQLVLWGPVTVAMQLAVV